MLSKFISAACTGITRERNITNKSSAESTTTIPMNRGSLLASTREKSIEPAVKPPTRTGTPVRCANGGRTSLRRWLTRLVVADACGADPG
jgi:hypothetical protein